MESERAADAAGPFRQEAGHDASWCRDEMPLLDRLSDHVWTADQDGVLRYANRRMRDHFGRDPTGERLLDLVLPEDARLLEEAWLTAKRFGEPFAMELRLPVEGGARWFLVRGTPPQPEGERAWVGTCTDIDGQHRRRKELERSMQAQRRAVATADHDLRQPLSAILFLVTGLARRVEDSSELRMLQAIGNAVHAMKVSVDNQVDFERLGSGVPDPAFAPVIGDVAVNPVLTRLALEFAPIAASKGLGFSVVPCSSVIRTDQQMFERMLRNLVFNAVRYTEHGRVLVGCRRRGEELSIEVHDTGRGIDHEERARLTEPFYRSARSLHQHPGGLGLGLTVVEGMSALLGHRLSLDTRVGRGSVFALTTALCPSPTRFVGPVRNGEGLRVLVLPGDEAMPREPIEALAGSVEWCADEEAAAAVISGGSWRPDLVLCGLVHGGSADGVLRLARLLRLSGEQARGGILCSTPEPLRLRELRLSGHPYLFLPLRADELQSRLFEILFRYG
ncbi:PAS domain-containing sensor histidine kinase [Arenibaculum sp.]|jgi:PAS domain S-box-containing protein|uniref:sensor histidine kinase n=1 Tax=Arenibaculum sp. TaxID=2865862 RepID=UPI002E15CD47|nr:PAS domain-containing sensor histidine kinase [Arenibaculum sp.]